MQRGTSGAGGGAPHRPSGAVRGAFLAILALWMTFPFVLPGAVAQDGVPYVVAGAIVSTHPESLYQAEEGGSNRVLDEFVVATCELLEDDACDRFTIAYVSTPAALPFSVGLDRLGLEPATLVMRFLGVACLAGGMWVLWRRLAHRTSRAPALLLATVILLTPFAMLPTTLGQTSQVLFLSACLSVVATDGRPLRTAGTALVWAMAVVLKAFPGALVLLLAAQRRWVLAAWGLGLVGALSLASLLVAPASVWVDFVRSTVLVGDRYTVSDHNGSLGAVVHHVVPSVMEHPVGSAAVTVVGVAAAVALMAWVWRRCDPDTQWATGYLALLVATPLVWHHYLWVVIAAVGVTLAGLDRLEDRHLLALPAFAAATVLITFWLGERWMPVVQGAVLAAGAGTVVALTRHRTPVAPPLPAVAAAAP